MGAGSRRHLITIQKSTWVKNSFNERENTWVDVQDVWARVRPLQGREIMEAQQVYASADSVIDIRYTTGIDPKKRIKFNSKYYDIMTVINPDERNIDLLIYAKVPST